jgi:hypothetical protein
LLYSTEVPRSIHHQEHDNKRNKPCRADHNKRKMSKFCLINPKLWPKSRKLAQFEIFSTLKHTPRIIPYMPHGRYGRPCRADHNKRKMSKFCRINPKLWPKNRTNGKIARATTLGWLSGTAGWHVFTFWHDLPGWLARFFIGFWGGRKSKILGGGFIVRLWTPRFGTDLKGQYGSSSFLFVSMSCEVSLSRPRCIDHEYGVAVGGSDETGRVRPDGVRLD